MKKNEDFCECKSLFLYIKTSKIKKKLEKLIKIKNIIDKY